MNKEHIIQGTTPTIEIMIEDMEEIVFDKVEVILRQCDTKIEKTGDAVKIEGNTLSVTLTQEETLSLKSGLSVAVQIRAIQGDTAYASHICPVSVYPLIENEIIEKGE